jgi:hypothetical protein
MEKCIFFEENKRFERKIGLLGKNRSLWKTDDSGRKSVSGKNRWFCGKIMLRWGHLNSFEGNLLEEKLNDFCKVFG